MTSAASIGTQSPDENIIAAEGDASCRTLLLNSVGTLTKARPA